MLNDRKMRGLINLVSSVSVKLDMCLQDSWQHSIVEPRFTGPSPGTKNRTAYRSNLSSLSICSWRFLLPEKARGRGNAGGEHSNTWKQTIVQLYIYCTYYTLISELQTYRLHWSTILWWGKIIISGVLHKLRNKTTESCQGLHEGKDVI